MKTVIQNFLIAIILVLYSYIAIAQSVEYIIKASFIEKFARFTDWGNNLPGDHFVIAVLGESPFNGELERMAKKVKIKSKPVKIKYITNYHEANGCQLLFISGSEKKIVRDIVKYTEQLGILTISDTPGFCYKGVHINLYLDESETIKYEVNPSTLMKSNLTVDIQLLSYGKIIRDTN